MSCLEGKQIKTIDEKDEHCIFLLLKVTQDYRNKVSYCNITL
jgi:hypothetical protein